jgi:hypothetical protein
MHFVSYALVKKSFSHIHCSPWDEIYVFVSLLVCYGYFGLALDDHDEKSMVDGYVF